MRTIGDLISHYEELLSKAGIEDARFDIIELLSEYTGKSKVEIRFLMNTKADENLVLKMDEAIKRMLEDEPVAYILGKAYFYREEYKVGKGVLIPRPDTEVLVEKAYQVILDSGIRNPVIWDLCTGSGCIGISLSNELLNNGFSSKTYLVDNFDEALFYTRENISQAMNPESIQIVKLDVLKDLSQMPGEKPDFILSNPPYITLKDMNELDKSVKDYEPHSALYGVTEDGLLFYEVLAKEASNLLPERGALIVEHGYDQEEQVKEIFNKNNLVRIECVYDFGGNPRVTIGYGGKRNG